MIIKVYKDIQLMEGSKIIEEAETDTEVSETNIKIYYDIVMADGAKIYNADGTEYEIQE